MSYNFKTNPGNFDIFRQGNRYDRKNHLQKLVQHWLLLRHGFLAIAVTAVITTLLLAYRSTWFVKHILRTP